MMKTLAALALVAASTQAVQARSVITFEFGLDGTQEVPANASPATGFASVLLDTDMNTLSWTITYSGLVAPISAAHFHGAAQVGVNAGVRVNIGALPSPIIGSAPITDDWETEILAGLWYINIHSGQFPGGEIRGQVVPAPAAAALLGLGGLVAMRRRR